MSGMLQSELLRKEHEVVADEKVNKAETLVRDVLDECERLREKLRRKDRKNRDLKDELNEQRVKVGHFEEVEVKLRRDLRDAQQTMLDAQGLFNGLQLRFENEVKLSNDCTNDLINTQRQSLRDLYFARETLEIVFNGMEGCSHQCLGKVRVLASAKICRECFKICPPVMRRLRQQCNRGIRQLEAKLGVQLQQTYGYSHPDWRTRDEAVAFAQAPV